ELIGSPDPNHPQNDRAAQGILGVVKSGNDPRALFRLIPKGEVQDPAQFEQYEVISRRQSGKLAKDHKGDREVSDYYKIPIDLVARVEELLPGSAAWESAIFWQLATPHLPPLEWVRAAIQHLIRTLRLCRPSFDERRLHLAPEDFALLKSQTLEEQIRVYRESLNPLIQNATADSLSLLATLTVESYIVDNDILFNLHVDATKQVLRELLSHELMADIRATFNRHVTSQILGMNWDEPDLHEPSSLTSPLMKIEDLECMVGAPVIYLP
ncbi:MAG TPA: hypothetical protein VGV14_01125, partial [Rhodanobacter sp.]|nr:hypothetical protein [Rhodanobacter sp.]